MTLKKIYYLSEIYNGGQLDLEALNIYGSEDGYAKVIGDGETIIANEDDLSAVNIGSQSYIILENLTIESGVRYGIFAKIRITYGLKVVIFPNTDEKQLLLKMVKLTLQKLVPHLLIMIQGYI